MYRMCAVACTTVVGLSVFLLEARREVPLWRLESLQGGQYVKYCASCYVVGSDECVACLGDGNGGSIKCMSQDDWTWESCDNYCLIQANTTLEVCNPMSEGYPAQSAFHYVNQPHCVGTVQMETCFLTHTSCRYAGRNPPGVNCP
jgi:hypothetical protein